MTYLPKMTSMLSSNDYSSSASTTTFNDTSLIDLLSSKRSTTTLFLGQSEQGSSSSNGNALHHLPFCRPTFPDLVDILERVLELLVSDDIYSTELTQDEHHIQQRHDEDYVQQEDSYRRHHRNGKNSQSNKEGSTATKLQ